MRQVVHKLEALWWLLIPVAAMALVWSLDPALHARQAGIGLLLRNALPVAVALLLIYGLSGRALFSLWIGGNLFFVLFLVNGIKERNLDAPLMPGDLMLAGQVFGNLEFFSQYTRSLALLGFGLVLVLAVAFVLWKYCVAVRRNPMLRWSLAGISVVLLYCMLIGTRPWTTVYSNHALRFSVWDPGPSVRRSGLLAGLVRVTQERQVEVPKPDEALIGKFLKSNERDIASRADRPLPPTLPDIVIVQSEAFFEPGIVKGIEDGQYVPNFERHPFKRGLWNRENVMPKLGFAEMHFVGDFAKAPRAGVYVSDQALFARVLQRLDKPADGPRMVMAITMENHGHWGHAVRGVDTPVQDADLPPGLSAEGRTELRYYLSHVRNGDRALGDFAQKLLARDRWTVLLFYGDHLPALRHAFDDLGFDDGKPHGSYEKTRYMLLSNRPIEPHRVDLPAFELPALLFNAIGLPEDGHLAFNGAVATMMMDDPSKVDLDLEQVLYNTARKEVLCRERLDASGRCKG